MFVHKNTKANLESLKNNLNPPQKKKKEKK